MPILILIVPLLACTADIAPGSIRAGNAVQQHYLQLKQVATDKVQAETLGRNNLPIG